MFDSTSHICMSEHGSIIVSSNVIFTLTAVKIKTHFFFCYLLQIQSSHESFMWTTKCLYNILTTPLIKIKKFYSERDIKPLCKTNQWSSPYDTVTQRWYQITVNQRSYVCFVYSWYIYHRVNMWFDALSSSLCYTKPFKNVLWNDFLCHFILLSAIGR